MRFVQFSDCHLDSAIGGALCLPEDKRDVLRQDIRRAVERACALATERQADLVLIPGDLFDYESLRPETITLLAGLLADLAPARVFISPGNHDSLRPASPYMDQSKWPGNVRIFTSTEFERVNVDSPGCTITGIAHAHRGTTDRLLADAVDCGRSGVDVLLFHGSRDGYRPSEKENILPFSDDELTKQHFSYAAIGHYHSYAAIADSAGLVRGAYSGCVQGRGLDEPGEKHALVGEISESGVTLEQVEVAERRIVRVEASLTGAATIDAVQERVHNALRASAAREQDIASISLTGLLAPTVQIDDGLTEFSSHYFHVCVSRSRLEADYDLENILKDSAASPVRSAFVKRMIDLQESAEAEDATALRDAIYYGLAALDGRKLEPRNAD